MSKIEKYILKLKIKIFLLKITLFSYKYKKKSTTKNASSEVFLLWDCLVDLNVESIDAFTLFQYLLTVKKEAYYVLLKDSPLYFKLKNEDKLKNIIIIEHSITTNPLEFLKAIETILFRTKYILTSFAENNKQIKKFFRKSRNFKYIFLQHGVTFLKESVFKKKYLNNKTFNRYLICSEYEKNLFKKYNFKEKQLILSGFPRWDLLNSKDLKETEKSIFIMFTWRNFKDMDVKDSLYYRKILSLFNNEKLYNFFNEYNMKIYFAPHHKILDSLNEIVVSKPYINLVPQDKISYYIRHSSMLLTDFSSVVFDFMFQDKPVVLYGLDLKSVNVSQNDKFDLDNLPLKSDFIPNVFFEEDDVLNCIKKYVDIDFKINQEEKIMYDKFFIVKKDICKHLVEKIENS